MKYAKMIVRIAEAIEKKYGSGSSDEMMEWLWIFSKRLARNWVDLRESDIDMLEEESTT